MLMFLPASVLHFSYRQERSIPYTPTSVTFFSSRRVADLVYRLVLANKIREIREMDRSSLLTVTRWISWEGGQPQVHLSKKICVIHEGSIRQVSRHPEKRKRQHPPAGFLQLTASFEQNVRALWFHYLFDIMSKAAPRPRTTLFARGMHEKMAAKFPFLKACVRNIVSN